MCYILALACFIVSVMFATKGFGCYIAFLVAAVLFGLLGVIFDLVDNSNRNKWKAMIETYTGMSPEQLNIINSQKEVK